MRKGNKEWNWGEISRGEMNQINAGDASAQMACGKGKLYSLGE